MRKEKNKPFSAATCLHWRSCALCKNEVCTSSNGILKFLFCSLSLTSCGKHLEIPRSADVQTHQNTVKNTTAMVSDTKLSWSIFTPHFLAPHFWILDLAKFFLIVLTIPLLFFFFFLKTYFQMCLPEY